MIGQTISNYKILEKIGAGGMGEVYLAEDIKLGRKVALKFLPEELSRDSHASRRFTHEARAASKLDHPNICSVHAIDTARDGRMFICMSYCDGEPLKNIIARGPMPMDEAVKVAVKIAEGLASAHKSGVTHRDIKPGNVIVTREGGVKIIDFGLAKLAGASRVTKAGATVGTIAYKSPEQTRGDDVDGRSDIWALGMVLFEMLTGESAFSAEFEQATVYSILNEKPRRATDIRGEVPAELERIVNKCLQKDPGNRYQTARDLADDLDGVAAEFGWSRVSREASGTRGAQRRRRNIVVGVAAVLAVITLVAAIVAQRGTVAKWIAGHDAPRERDVAVLRFACLGPGDSFGALCDGLVETLTSKLTQMEGAEGTFRVVPSSEIRGRNIQSVREAHDAFGIGLAITGSVQRIGNGLRLTINLVNASTERQLKSAIINDPMTDTSVLQDTTVVKLAEMLSVELPAETRKIIAAGGTSVAKAYKRYLEGRGVLQRRDRVENIDRAIELFTSAVEHDSLYALAYAGLGEAYWLKYVEQKDTALVERAKTYCRRAADINDMSAPVHITLGIVNAGSGRYNEAVDDFQRALRIEPANYEALLGLANVYTDLNRPEEAENTYLTAIESRPDYWSAYSHLGAFYFQRGRLEEAVEKIQKVIELYPGNIRAYNNLIVFYYMMGDVDMARETFDGAITQSPDAETYSNMGTVYILEERYADAVPILEKAVELAENNAVIWSNLADAYRYTAGMKEEAIAAYRRTIELGREQLAVNPKNAYLRATMAVQYAKLGDHDAALALITTAREQLPGEQKIQFQSMIVDEIAGRREEALRTLERLLEAGGYVEQIKNDPELADLRESPDYQRRVSP